MSSPQTGKEYQVTFDMDLSEATNPNLTVEIYDNTSGLVEIRKFTPAQGQNSFWFTARSANTVVKFQNNDPANAAYNFYVDNVEIKKLATSRALGDRQYELSNHLGNVLTTISDRRYELDANSDGVIDNFLPDILASKDYFAFGAPLEGWGNVGSPSSKYRFGFNGKENDIDIAGTGEGGQDYGMRIYNPSLGKFLSVDPLAWKYPGLTTYQFATNTPVQAIDLDGLEKAHYSLTYADGKPVFKLLGIQMRMESNAQAAKEFFSFDAIHYDWKEYNGAYFTEWSGIDVHTDEGTYNFKTVDEMVKWANTSGPKKTLSKEQRVEAMQIIFTANMIWTDLQDGDFDNIYIPKTQSKQQARANNGIKANGENKVQTKSNDIAEEYVNEGTRTIDQPFTGGIQYRKDQKSHIFTQDHNLPLTPENEQLLINISNDSRNLLGTDENGNTWYAKLNEKGEQIWTSVRKNQIQNGGINTEPLPYSPKTGLSKESAPRKMKGK